MLLFFLLNKELCVQYMIYKIEKEEIDINQSINRVYFQTKCEQSKQININQISLIIIMHW